MFNWLRNFLYENQRCYMICFHIPNANTPQETFTQYNALVPADLQVTEDNFSWQTMIPGIKGWVFVCSRGVKNRIIKTLKQSSEANYISYGITKRKHKSNFHFGI